MLPPGAQVHAVEAHGLSACAVLADDSLRCWGRNAHAELGLGDQIDRGASPDAMGAALPLVNLGTGRRVESVAMHDFIGCAALDDGAVKCWGWNAADRLGVPSTGANDHRGDVPSEMGDALVPVPLGTARARDITLGAGFTCALLDTARIKCWGASNDGALGDGPRGYHGARNHTMGDALPEVDLGTGARVAEVRAGRSHVCARLEDGRVKCWGNNEHGQLGLGDARARGSVDGEMGDNLPAVRLGTGRRAVRIAAGADSSCAVLDDGHLKCWGDNQDAQLGLGDVRPRGLLPEDMGDALAPVDLGTHPAARVREVAIARQHACARLDDGRVKCWGDASKLGIGENTGARGDKPSDMGDALPAVRLE
jgi:alpha-tubulin suppressor-like RCC1 family protein